MRFAPFAGGDEHSATPSVMPPFVRALCSVGALRNTFGVTNLLAKLCFALVRKKVTHLQAKSSFVQSFLRKSRKASRTKQSFVRK